MVHTASRPNRSLGDEIRLDYHARFSEQSGARSWVAFAAHYKEPHDIACQILALVRDCGKYHDLVRPAGFLIRKLCRDIMETRSSPRLFSPLPLHHHAAHVREQQVS